MKQVINNLKNGEVTVIETPPPNCCPGGVLIATKVSLVSPGTEKMLLDFGKSSLLNKAIKNPERVQQVLNKARTDGLSATISSVKNKLDQPFQLGYCNTGVVIESRCEEFKVGDRVVSNGPHAEIVSVPKHLVAKIPKTVSDEAAVFTVLGSIALHGVRLSKPTMGETFFVIGLGLVGLLAVQILKANGCNVLCYDLNSDRVKLAVSYGAIGVEFDFANDINKLSSFINAMTDGVGVDAVIITTSTSSNEPIKVASKISRKRGRIILIGTAGLSFDRSEFYEKEIRFQVSCSYGPGRYDPNYEILGIDYPYAYVRWTEQRNFKAILNLINEGKIKTENLIDDCFDISQGKDALDALLTQNAALGVLINYPKSHLIPSLEILSKGVRIEDKINVGWIGAGAYASKELIPKFSKTGCNLEVIASQQGLSATHNAQKFGFTGVTNSNEAIYSNKIINTVVVATRHDSHAKYVISALDAEKHVYCEKPLCLNMDDLEAIKKIKSQRPNLQLMIGFNRRFAPLVTHLYTQLQGKNSAKTVIITVNAGYLEKSHWTQDPSIGGGRLIGEACHFIDLSIFLTQSEIIDFNVMSTDDPDKNLARDNFSLSLKHANGSISQIHYLTRGAKNFQKERIEVFCEGKIYRIDNFLKFSVWDSNHKKTKIKWRQDKGQEMLINLFINSLRNGSEQIIPLEHIYQSAEIAILLDEMMKK
ncbi:bi-domain-containing oxidoreductase [Planktomarina sp.]|nr:bi-domain-containing oxidoreductase [Planktomarina sp.]